MLKLKVDIRVTGEDWRTITEASATTDVAEGTASNLSYYVSSLVSTLGDAVAAEVVKHVGSLPEGDDDGGE